MKQRDSSLRSLDRPNWSVHQVALRAVMVCSIVGAVITTWAVGDPLSYFGAAVLFGLLGVSVRFPDSHAGLPVLLGVVWYWAVAIDDPTRPWTVLVALLVLAYHAASALAASTPAGADLDVATLWLWARRVAVVALVTVAVWALTLAADRLDAPGGTAVAGATLVFLGACTLALRAGLRPQEDA